MRLPERGSCFSSCLAFSLGSHSRYVDTQATNINVDITMWLKAFRHKPSDQHTYTGYRAESICSISYSNKQSVHTDAGNGLNHRTAVIGCRYWTAIQKEKAWPQLKGDQIGAGLASGLLWNAGSLLMGLVFGESQELREHGKRAVK